MKTFKEFQEAVSPARLAQLQAKGKGQAAAAKMKADGLTGKMQGSKEKARRVAQGQGGMNKGGALAVIPKSQTSLAVNPKRAARDKAVSMAGNFIKNKAGEAVNKGVTNVLAKRDGHTEPKPRGQARGYMTSPDTTTNSRTRPVNKKAQARRAVKKGLMGATKGLLKRRDTATTAKQPGGAPINPGKYNSAF